MGVMSSDWVLRGDLEGYYGISATYTGTLDTRRPGRLDLPHHDRTGIDSRSGGSACT